MEAYFPNGWMHYLVGGGAIGLGVSLLFIGTGLIGGMSTVYSSTWSFVLKQKFFQQARFTTSRQWRLIYALGLVCGALLACLLIPRAAILVIPWWQLLLGGVIAGFGARLGNGCTSGHGICGMASFNKASMVAVIIFLGVAIGTARIVIMLGGFK